MAQRQAYHVRRHKIGALCLPPLTNIKVLAIRAEPITATCSNGEYFRPWHVVDYGLLFDRVNMSGDHFSIDEKLEFSPVVLSEAAEAHFSFWSVAVWCECLPLDPELAPWL